MSYISRRNGRNNISTFMSVANKNCNTRDSHILEKIQRYFSTPGRIDSIIPYIEERKTAMSLRDFEAFNVHVAPWTDAHFTKEEVTPGTNGRITSHIFFIYQKYKAQLKSYNKETFDPFRRGVAFEFEYTFVDPETGEKESRSLFTAICQLNYFLWCHSNGVLNYIQTNNVTISEYIKKLDRIKKKISRDAFKALILEKQRYPRCYEEIEITTFTPISNRSICT